MDNDTLQRHLLRLFERHEVELEPDEDWLVTDGDFPAIRAAWHEGAAGGPGRLDLDVVLGEDQQVEESYAGFGDGEAGCRDALRRFEQGGLPVLLAACWYVTDERRLRLESWDIGVRGWDVFIGPAVVQGAPAALADDALAPLAAALRNEALEPRLHWVRLFLRRDADGRAAVEALLDNEPWAAGDRALASVALPEAAEPYSVHRFLMLDVRDY
ncbi:hypothetical protein ASG87_09950 [Frateuria sp. Soil773]|uniref:DUF6348 family protein n=1 Tax=Frateuria sp. Soil773 TaxID=1736407 RepID=UPI0006F94B4B|nr:DUF6348 family protein [Frateuria sp. Soil773]KRF01824.1 hypothetical protein ASG87_09950 [Frateuria sp. Soil773]